MTIQLLKGHFSPQEATDILTKMVQIKIKFQEDKINSGSNEEDIKMREKRIKQLQTELSEVRNYIREKETNIALESCLEIH